MMAEIVDDNAWLVARRELLDEEKAFQKARDDLARKRRGLPWRKIDAAYVFDAENGQASLADMFDGRSQLLVYHFMFHPEWDAGCKSCSFWADSYNGSVTHLKARDVSLVAVSRASLDLILAYRERMGWSFPWVSSAMNTFNYDFGVSFSRKQIESGTANYNYKEGNARIEELPGISVFARKGDDVYHTYSTYSRGLDPYSATYQLLDIVPKGRDEDDLPYKQDWIRRHDEYL
jgi:predicted dithiol-disulfide oxidoreductase (DUF899 family)